jgi:hypothetical protein
MIMNYDKQTRTITADTGKELYRIANPEMRGGKGIILGKNDKLENWAERDYIPPAEPEINEMI